MSHPHVFRTLLSGNLSDLKFEPFRAGVEICQLSASATGDPTVALLRYEAGASVPLHMHSGVETIAVLSGSQSDEYGTYNVGDVIVNLPGSSHSVWSDTGCLVLISWASPVRILDA